MVAQPERRDAHSWHQTIGFPRDLAMERVSYQSGRTVSLQKGRHRGYFLELCPRFSCLLQARKAFSRCCTGKLMPWVGAHSPLPSPYLAYAAAVAIVIEFVSRKNGMTN